MSLLVANSVSLIEKLGGFEFTVYWILDSLARNDKVFQEKFSKKTIAEIDTKDVSVNRGFFSTVLKVELMFHDKSRYTTILKVPGTESLDAVEFVDNVEEFKLVSI